MAAGETLGQELRRIRTALGMSQRETAEYCGVSVQSISLWERDKREFNSWEQQKLIRQCLNKLKRRRKWREGKQ